MFVVNDDLSIYLTRGDIANFTITADDENGEPFVFPAGSVVRFKVFDKKACENVKLQKDFPIEEETTAVMIELTEEDTRIGKIISKPVDYWYEVEFDPLNNPQTIIGYDDDGAKIFKLFPEGADAENPEINPEDIPIVDAELSLTSSRPVENQAIAKAVAELRGSIKEASDSIKGSDEKIQKLTQEISSTNDAVTQAKKDISANKQEADEHIANKENPHEVTAGQVGALALIGGILSGDTGVEKTTAEASSMYVQNFVNDMVRKISIHASATGNTGLFDQSVGDWLARMDKDGNGYFYGGLRCKKVLETEANLDNYTKPGVYYFSSAYTPTNLPTGVNGVLIVHGDESIVKQIWMRQGTIGSNDHNTWFRTKVGTWSGWKRVMMEDEAPVYGGNAQNGYVRFPGINLQICWQLRTFTNITIPNAWSTMYESGVLSFLDFAASFSAVPTCIKTLTGSNFGCLMQPYSAVTKTNPGNCYAVRPDKITTGTTLYGMVIAVGKYA